MLKDLTLCTHHNFIKSELNDIKKYLKKYGNLQPNDVIFDKINGCLDLTRKAKKLGQKLENRCRKYRNCIESLGFSRIYSDKDSKPNK